MPQHTPKKRAVNRRRNANRNRKRSGGSSHKGKR